MPTYFHHDGAYPTPTTEKNAALRFLANYTQRIDSADYDTSYLPYYHPKAVFHDATGVDYVGGQAIWTWITNLFAPFSRIYMETRHILVTSYEDGTHEIFCEWYAHFWPKDSVGDDGKVSIPRAMVFKLGPAEGDGSQGRVGFEGLQIVDARLYYDRSLLLPLLVRSKQEKEKFGQ